VGHTAASKQLQFKGKKEKETGTRRSTFTSNCRRKRGKEGEKKKTIVELEIWKIPSQYRGKEEKRRGVRKGRWADIFLTFARREEKRRPMGIQMNTRRREGKKERKSVLYIPSGRKKREGKGAHAKSRSHKRGD